MTTYYVIRRIKDGVFYGKNPNYMQTGNTKWRHGFDAYFPPFLYKSERSAWKAIVSNYTILTQDVEILSWNTDTMQKLGVRKYEQTR